MTKQILFLLLILSETLHASDSILSIPPDTIRPLQLNCDMTEQVSTFLDSIPYQQLLIDTNDVFRMQAYPATSHLGGFRGTLDRFISSKAFKMTNVGIPLVIGAMLERDEDAQYRVLRNEYLPVFRKRYDDYFQYLPAAVMLGLKVGGVKGRSSWSRMLTSDAFSVLLMATAVNTLKYSISVERPDGSNRHSFPSGHTAVAFMTATMLSKEYGDRSPWYSIGAYSVATATGVGRMLNNKHWLSDVMMGAGIGILSTEMGYFFADLLFKDKGITHFSSNAIYNRYKNPSFLGVYYGFSVLPGKYKLNNGSHMERLSGTNAGAEGAYFFNPYIGVGGRFAVANIPVILNDVTQDEPLDILSSYLGAYFSYPLSYRCLIGSKVLLGYSYLKEKELDSLTIGNTGRFSMGTGFSFTYRARQNFGVKFFVDYDIVKSVIPSKEDFLHILMVGVSTFILF